MRLAGLNSFLMRAFIELVLIVPTSDADPKNKPFRPDDSSRKKSPSVTLSNCYSCMNMEFLEYWNQVEHTYSRPSNFTDACLTMPQRANIGYIHCETACIIIKEQRLAGGSSQGYNVVRGCMATVTRYQLSADVIGLSRRSLSSRNICHSIEAKHLYPEYISNINPPTRDSNSPTNTPRFLVTICTCYGHLCNGEAIAASDKRFKIFFTPFLISSIIVSLLYNPFSL